MRKFTTWLMILALLLSLAYLPTGASAASSLKQHQSRLGRVQQLIRNQRDKLFHIKKRERHARTKLNRTQGILSQTRNEIKDINSRLISVRQELEDVRARLEAARVRVEKQKLEMGERMARMYKYGRVSYLSVVLGANDYGSFVNRMRFLHVLVRQDADVLNNFLRQKEAVAATEKVVAAKEREIRSLKAQVKEKELVIRAQAWAEGATLKDIHTERARYEQQLAELEKNSQQIERMIRRMMNTPRGRKRTSVAWSGSFAMPVSGRITSYFGYRVHPIYGSRRMHTGIDIGVPMGTPVRAAAAGEVLFTGYWGGYGIVVILDHGGGVSTLYAHNSRVAVHAGQSVGRGQVVSYAGSTGNSTGPHVHFEVRRNGTPVNPLGG